MTTYYDDEYNAYTEEDLYPRFYEWIDEEYPTVTIFEAQFYPSNMIGEPGTPDHDETFNSWLNYMQDSEQLTEEHQLDIDSLLDDWLHGDGWSDSWEEVDPTELLYAAQHMHSTGRLELVNGEIQPHPDHTISDIQELINNELAW